MRIKTLLPLFFCFQMAFAQVNITVSETAPSRMLNKIYHCANGKYIIKQTSPAYNQQGTGKFLVYSPESKLLGSINYTLPIKVKDGVIVGALADGDKLTMMYANAIGGHNPGKEYVFWTVRFQSNLYLQDYDLKTYKPIGTPRTIEMPIPKSGNDRIHILCSPNGKYFAFLQHDMIPLQKVKYTLFKEGGVKVFEKEYTLSTYTGSNDIREGNAAMSNNGDLIIACADKDAEDKSNTVLYYIDAATQKLSSKKLEVKGKLVEKYPQFVFSGDGALIVAGEFSMPGKNTDYTAGYVVEKYNGSLEQQQKHVEVTFSATTIEKCKSSDSKNNPAGTMFRQRLRQAAFTDDGGLVLYTEQNVTRQTGPKQWDVVTNNVLCMGLNKNLETVYEQVAHQLDKKSSFVIFQDAGMYANGDYVYVFHAGKEDNVKNTKDEFDLYCTYWQHSNPQPKTFEVNRSYPDQHIFVARLREMGANQLLIQSEGNGGTVYTTMEIEQK